MAFLVSRRWLMAFQGAHNFRGKAARDFLRNLCVSGIPVFRARLDGQLQWRRVGTPDCLEMADVDFAYQCKPSLRRSFEVISEHIPMFGKRNNCQSAD